MTDYNPPVNEDFVGPSYKNDPVPEFGHSLLKYWSFEPNYINLNNGTVSEQSSFMHQVVPNTETQRFLQKKKGSYGASPHPVLQACSTFDAQSEANPDKFFRFVHKSALAEVREGVSKLINVEADEVAIVPNATHALNTILRNFEWKAGDVMVQSEHSLVKLHPRWV
jgi:hercynylcysteine S-oxide lyase